MIASRSIASRTIRRHLITALIIAFTAPLFPGCMDADPFGLAYRRVAGDYELYESEGHDYYLTRDGQGMSNGVGCIEGVVKKLGWNDNYIFAKRRACFRSDGDGWMIVNLNNDTITGPLSDEEFRRRFPKVEVDNVRDAWEKL